MVRNEILCRLSPFRNQVRIIESDQDVNDIIKGILSTHKRHRAEYDKISEMFYSGSEKDTAKNLWQFLKRNVPYRIETTDRQTLRSPSAILALPADCKSYALFINGVVDSLNRKGLLSVPIAYRYASYDDNIRDPQHVFSVMYPGSANEIWIDPVLSYFNEKKRPSYIKDRKLPMSLIALAGTNQAAELASFQRSLIREKENFLRSGIISPGSAEEKTYNRAINNITATLQGNSLGVIPISASDVSSVVNLVSSIFKKKSLPGDQWKSWDRIDIRDGKGAGASAADIIRNNRTDVPLGNVISYIQANGLQGILSQNAYPVSTNMIVDWLQRNGFETNVLPADSVSTKDNELVKKNYTVPLLIGGAALVYFATK